MTPYLLFLYLLAVFGAIFVALLVAFLLFVFMCGVWGWLTSRKPAVRAKE